MISLQTDSNSQTVDDSSTAALTTLQDQANGQPQYSAPIGNRLPFGRPSGSMYTRAKPNGRIAISVSVGGKQTQEIDVGQLDDDAYNLGPFTSSSTDPTTDDIAEGQWGWHLNTSTNALSFARNVDGVITYPNPSGTLNFTAISGTISDTQHGARGGGTLHSAATTLAAGFMTTTQVSTLAAVSGTVTDITSTGTPTHLLNGTVIRVNGTRVVSDRITGYTNFSNISFIRDISSIDFSTVITASDANFRLLCRFVAAIAHDIGINEHGLIDCN